MSAACVPGPTDDPPLADSCSAGWWTAWANCPITPVRNLGWEASRADDLLARLPWIEAAPDRQIVGHLFYGNRPLPLGGTFPDGMNAKLLWEFARPIAAVSITATRLDPPEQSVTIIGARSDHPVGETQVPSLMAMPGGGCWRVEIRAEDRDGNAVSGAASFVVIDG
jgi:hypothetical protein